MRRMYGVMLGLMLGLMLSLMLGLMLSLILGLMLSLILAWKIPEKRVGEWGRKAPGKKPDRQHHETSALHHFHVARKRQSGFFSVLYFDASRHFIKQ